MLEITVHEIRGTCPVHSVGDRIIVDGSPVALGLTTSEDPAHAYMQCVDPGPPYTEGGTVIFRCRKIVRE